MEQGTRKVGAVLLIALVLLRPACHSKAEYRDLMIWIIQATGITLSLSP